MLHYRIHSQLLPINCNRHLLKDVKIPNVSAQRDGQDLDVNLRTVTLDAIFMANAKMEPVYVFLDGTESIVL